MQADSDSLLWASFKKGDKNAFKAIYQKHVPALINYGNKITSDPSLVEDSIQDLFVELWNSGENLSDTTSIKFYLFKALRFKINRNRSTSHSTDMVALDGFLTLLKTPSQEDSIIQREARSYQLQHLKATLDLLPDRQREAINLRFYHNFSNEDISRIMGINYNSACKFIYAALKRLKDNLKIAVSISLSFLAHVNLL